jgi:hypothetical protein
MGTLEELQSCIALVRAALRNIRSPISTIWIHNSRNDRKEGFVMPIFTLIATTIVAELGITVFSVAQIATGLGLIPSLGRAFSQHVSQTLELNA